jgi:hypothetical protein
MTAELRAYNPSWKDRLASALLGDSKAGTLFIRSSILTYRRLIFTQKLDLVRTSRKHHSRRLMIRVFMSMDGLRLLRRKHSLRLHVISQS